MMKATKEIKKTKISQLPTFDMAHYLNSDKAIIEYLNQVLEEGDDALLAEALGDIARAKGMAQIAQSTGITREALYKALRPNAKPRFDTISKVIGALGIKLVAHSA
jgi:probable addiction module antidote protein